MLSRLCIVGAVLALLSAAWTQQVGVLLVAALFTVLADINREMERARRDQAEAAAEIARLHGVPPYRAGDET